MHLVTIIYAVRGGLTAAEILGARAAMYAGSCFYAVFVAAVAVHAPIGLRTYCLKRCACAGAALDIAVLLLGIVLALWGWRAVFAVFQWRRL